MALRGLGKGWWTSHQPCFSSPALEPPGCAKGGHGGAAMRGNGKDQRGVVVRLPLARRSCAHQPLTLLSSVMPFSASLRVRGAQRRAVQRGGLRHGQGVCGRHRSASPGDEWLHGVRGLMRPWQSPWGRGGGVQTPGARTLPSTRALAQYVQVLLLITWGGDRGW